MEQTLSEISLPDLISFGSDKLKIRRDHEKAKKEALAAKNEAEAHRHWQKLLEAIARQVPQCVLHIGSMSMPEKFSGDERIYTLELLVPNCTMISREFHFSSSYGWIAREDSNAGWKVASYIPYGNGVAEVTYHNGERSGKTVVKELDLDVAIALAAEFEIERKQLVAAAEQERAEEQRHPKEPVKRSLTNEERLLRELRIFTANNAPDGLGYDEVRQIAREAAEQL